MGKRKERRLAAMSNAGRRVKLDLFAEPSEGLGGSSAREGVTEDLDSEHRAGLPNSPSSSGQQPENPLLLLGQYSDDEFGVQSSKSDDDLAVLSSMANDNDQVKGTLAEDCKNIDTDAVEDLTQTVEQKGQDKDFTPRDGIINMEANDSGEIDATGAGSLCKEMDSTGQDSVLGMSAMQSGDVYSGWKMVLHEESSQYYYWNTETGETSWEIPKILAQGTALTFEQETLPITQGTHEASSNLVEVGDSSAMLTKVVCGSANLISDAGKLDKQNEKVLESGNQGNESNQIQITTGSAAGNYPYGDTPFVENYLYSENSGDALLVNGESAGTGSNEHLHEIPADEEHRTGIYISYSLINHGEFLLEKLKSLKQHEHDWVSKYVLEIEVRLFDIRALMSYGSSLLPFWEYSEKRLKQLELAMNDEISHSAKTTSLSETSTDSAIKGEDKLMESLKHGNIVHGPLKGAACSSEPAVVSPNASTPFFQNYSPNEAPNNDVNAECVPPSVYSISHSDDPVGVNGEEICNGNGFLGEFVPKPGLNAGEDEDMDVDMEVDDAIPASNTIYEDTHHTGAFALPQESAVQPNPPMGYSGLTSEDVSIVPPPPDEEWIPPPPPENELVPPPPPDEPEPSCPLPPTYSDALPPSYAEPYKLSYPDSSFDYYGQTFTEVTSSNIYGHHIPVLHQPAYYEVIPSTYANAAPTLVNPIGNVAPLPVVAGAESSGYESKSGSEAYSGLPTSQIGSFAAISNVTTTDVSAVADVTLIPDAPAIANVTSVAPLDGPIVSTLAQAVAATSVIESDPVPSIKAATTSSRATTGTSATAGSSTAKIVSKALRSKKRTVSVAPSLRSNKKVSKLVDKWKAAKEELHEDDEDEPENSYDFMEKKRQREIEEWRAQQISSGEARDNANFLPLGGNWRERVKRRKAARETAPTPSEAVADENPQPDLMPLCRDLPSGWQACWDESSKQVYYANIATSETTWTKPTK